MKLDLNSRCYSYWPLAARLFGVDMLATACISATACIFTTACIFSTTCSLTSAICFASLLSCSPACADDLFSNKSLFDNDDLFNDNEVKKSEAAQASKAKVEAVNKAVHQREMMTSMAINDGQLFDQMRQVASWVDNWVVFNHRFPEVGDETTYALQQLNELVPNNPYRSGSAYMVSGETVDNAYLNQEGEQPSPPMADSKVDSDRVCFVRDYGLTVPEVDQFSADPPVDWRAKPGTITVITNDQYLFIIWGAGADGKPLRDFGSKRVRFAVGNYQRWDAPVMDNQAD